MKNIPNQQCKYCMREITFVNGKWLTAAPEAIFPEYCGAPYRPSQKHEPKKENRKSGSITNIEELKND